jgi:hypothetical protein
MGMSCIVSRRRSRSSSVQKRFVRSNVIWFIFCHLTLNCWFSRFDHTSVRRFPMSSASTLVPLRRGSGPLGIQRSALAPFKLPTRELL